MTGFGRKAGASLVFACALAGCAIRPEFTPSSRNDPCAVFPGGDAEILERHALEVDDRGTTADFADRFSAIMRGLEAYKTCRGEAKPPARLLIYAHGGLNAIAAAKRHAVEQAPLMREDGYYPVFLIWRTGPFETYWDQIAHVRMGEVSELPSPTFPLYIVGDLGQGFARAPVNFKNQVKRYWLSEVDRDAAFEIDVGAAHANRANPDSIYYNVALSADFRNDRTIDAGSAFKETLYYLLMPVRVVVTFLLDPLGKTAWENMIRRALSTIHRTAEFETCIDGANDAARCAAQRAERRDYPHGSGGFSKFFQELEDCFATRASQKSAGAGRECLLGRDGEAILAGIKVTVIGHSMGTIVFNELASLYPHIPYENVVYMASAASIRHFMDTIVPLLRRRPDMTFHNLMLHPLAEARERSVHQGAAPSGTLLEWIDEMFEPSVTPLDRTLGKWRNVRVAKHLLEEGATRRIRFKIFGFGADDPQEHMQFNDTAYRYWCRAFWDGGDSSADDACAR